jgi:hypothetical protein
VINYCDKLKRNKPVSEVMLLLFRGAGKILYMHILRPLFLMSRYSGHFFWNCIDHATEKATVCRQNAVGTNPSRMTGGHMHRDHPMRGFSHLKRFGNESVNLPCCALLKRGPEPKARPPRVTWHAHQCPFKCTLGLIPVRLAQSGIQQSEGFRRRPRHLLILRHRRIMVDRRRQREANGTRIRGVTSARRKESRTTPHRKYPGKHG